MGKHSNPRVYKTRVGYAPTLVRVCYKLTPEAIAIVKAIANRDSISSGEAANKIIKLWAERSVRGEESNGEI